MMCDFDKILAECVERLHRKGENALQAICNLLHDSVPHYNWVGFYWMNDAQGQLELGPYRGAATEHDRIPYGKGICGQVAVSGKNYVVQNVDEADNYLACSIETRAEIVIPIYKEERLIGQIDIDSHSDAPFTEDDERFLAELCARIALVL